MDKKRKSKGGDEDADDHATKKRKMPSDSIDLSQPETAEGTTQQGLKLVDILKKTEDKSLVTRWARTALQHYLQPT
ncbi:hypothetical protein M7I_0169 [Glarea lozoyensis 74030]|uniref:Uncharacterized protein n=1 Tax=Glarea lozoyensis (strain ATCC 74030 / MF5533) TaxID=1104152 RepID=H0ECM6_GLAL7|nr:hypothetical protein M7I_0169 [Glarea lozoyensis 74030]